MTFNSLIFLFAFLPVCLILYFCISNFVKNENNAKFSRNIVLICMSLLFYSWGANKWILLLVASILLNYWLLRVWIKYRINNHEPISKTIWIGAMILNICTLAWFKYFAGILPLGISFFSFKILSSWFDIKNILKSRAETTDTIAQNHALNKLDLVKKSQSNNIPSYIEYDKFLYTNKITLINYFLYISFFPELISGPISRFERFTNQIDNIKISLSNIEAGLRRFLPALFVKVLISDNIFALRTTLLVEMPSGLGMAEAWLVSIFYTIYIYLDFASYSAMAIGLGTMLGFEVPENFNSPYSAKSITDFWRRWHMTLSSWFKDYVYIPLGGNRKGKARQLLNISIVWGLTGIWHGNYLNFLLWGLFYGLILIIEKLYFLKLLDKWPIFIRRIITLIIVNFGWVLFAFPKRDELFSIIGSMFGTNGLSNGTAIYILSGNIVLILLALFCSTNLAISLKNRWNNSFMTKTTLGILLEFILVLALFTLSVAFILDQSFTSFLYFQF